MRTTLNLPDALAREVKLRAAAEGRTFTSYLGEALREHLARELPDAEIKPLPTYMPKKPGSIVDLEDKDAIWDALDGAE